MAVVWITGGGTGIGRALAEACLQRGDSVAISGRRAEVLQNTAREIDPSGQRVLVVAGDVGDPGFAAQAVSQIHARWEKVDCLINNAGHNDSRSMEAAQPDDYLAAFKINCLGAIHCAQAVLPGMRSRRQGKIITISSIYGRWASANSPTYSTAKYAVTGFSDSLRQAVMGSGVHVMTVFPGFICTDMTMPYVKPGSLKARFGARPASIAKAILRAADRGRRELYYPLYVSWALRLYRWFPGLLDKSAVLFRRKTENGRGQV